MFDVDVASPPNRDELVAEILIRHETSVDQPAEIFRDEGRVMLALYSRADGAPWEFPLADFLEAVGRGMQRLGW